MIYNFWNVGEQYPFPNLGKTSTAKIMQALVILGGRMHDSYVEDNDEPLHRQYVVYRIALPVGREDEFEQLAGYKLSELEQVTGS